MEYGLSLCYASAFPSFAVTSDEISSTSTETSYEFAHLAKLLDDFHLAASNEAMKLLKAQISEKWSLTPPAHMVSL